MEKGLEILSIIFPFWLVKELIWEVLSLDNNPPIMAKFVQGQSSSKNVISNMYGKENMEFILEYNSKLM